MNKGFTLIELLIVMIIISVLVAIALPQYKRSVERGRALEGINTLHAVSDYMNAQYILQDFTYPTGDDINLNKMDLLQSRYFEDPMVTVSNNTVTVTVSRKAASGWNYQLSATSTKGKIGQGTCTSEDNTCVLLGLDKGI